MKCNFSLRIILNTVATYCKQQTTSSNSSKLSKFGCVFESILRFFLAFIFVSVCVCVSVCLCISCLCVHRVQWSDLWRVMALWAKPDFVLGKTKACISPQGETSVRVLRFAAGVYAGACMCFSCGCEVNEYGWMGFSDHACRGVMSEMFLHLLYTRWRAEGGQETLNLIWKIVSDLWEITEVGDAEL